MKHLIFAVITALCTLTSAAQNGGQSEQNNAVRLTFMGLINGNFYVKVTNRLIVTSQFKFDNTKTTSTFNLGGFKDTLINMGKSINGIVKVKNNNPFPGVDNGWVEICLVVSPLRFVSSRATYLEDTDELKIEFTVADVSNISRIDLEVSIDGKTYYPLALTFPEPLKENKSYYIKLPANRIRALIKK